MRLDFSEQAIVLLGLIHWHSLHLLGHCLGHANSHLLHHVLHDGDVLVLVSLRVTHHLAGGSLLVHHSRSLLVHHCGVNVLV